ncbi:MAG: 5-formyltetrahydrofolate cyclo-ligase [Candidatus Omnitrophica bacterium]|nr:5-formyltetrahydrofolate cyclo-ligase [Candidatus Omnitrophota bacterium]
MVEKRALRRALLRRLRGQPERARQAKSRAIGRRLRRLAIYRRAKTLLCYVAFDGEVETRRILEKALADGKRVAVPVTVTSRKRLLAAEIRDPDRDLGARGPFGIPQPQGPHRRRLALKDLELVLVPGLAFDRRGHRLGRGGGYFDRLLARLPTSCRRVGLAFDFQLLKELPIESHDLPVCAVVTEKKAIPSR